MIDSLRSIRGTVVYGVLYAGAIVAFLSVAGLFIGPVLNGQPADMRIEPSHGGAFVGDTFTVQVVVDSTIPVNVFKGQIRFDYNVLQVDSINYNTSIANLWAELPWYENGEGTVNFAGGTTHKGGFLGKGSLVTITFRTKAPGSTVLRLEDARILEHNGLGTDVPLKGPIDALFNVEDSVIESQTVSKPSVTTLTLAVTKEAPTTDLNGDGKQTITDVSIFMLNVFGSNDIRFDFNQDGVVDRKDMGILMSAQ